MTKYIAVHALVMKDELDEKADAPKNFNPGAEVNISDKDEAEKMLKSGSIISVAQHKANQQTQAELQERSAGIADEQRAFDAASAQVLNDAAETGRPYSPDEVPGLKAGIDTGEAGASTTKVGTAGKTTIK